MKKPVSTLRSMAQQPVGTSTEQYGFLLEPPDQVLFEFRGGADMLVITNRCLIVIGGKRIMGGIEYHVHRLSSATSFRVRGGGAFELNVELTITFMGTEAQVFLISKGVQVREFAAALSRALA